MKKLLLLVLFTVTAAHAQIKGTVTDAQNNPLPFVSIYLDDSFRGTTSNDQGEYELAIRKPGTYTLVFQYLGYKTRKVTTRAEVFPHTVDVALVEENIALNEVVIKPGNNPANHIIRNAISSRKVNTDKAARYRADFYSRGIFRIKDAPKKVLGTKLDMFDEVLDSTRSGILYLSETVSKIVYEKPGKLKETIIASKVSGKDNGFSFNNAASVNFDLYENTLPFEVAVISPIASNAFSYYKYWLEGTFFEDGKTVNKIRVTPRRDTEPVVEGYIYIVDDSWAIYAADLSIKGNRIQVPAISLLTLKQQFSYSKTSDIWVKNTQVLDFEAGMLGVNLSGRFTYVYSNYEFAEQFPKRTFTAEVLTFEQGANKKDDSYWDQIRPVPLTLEESRDYGKKDSLQQRRNSRTYKDSVDRKRNKFSLWDILTGYTYRNSFRNESYSYDGLLSTIGFNTVQGYNFETGFSYTRRNPEAKTYTTIGVEGNYGFSEDRLRVSGYATRKFNNITNRTLTLSGGSSIEQFNPSEPISRIVNSIATTFFRKNYMKLYDLNFARASFQEEVTNGLHLTISTEFSRRKQLFNNTNESIIRNNKKGYTSNNPLAPGDFTTPFFETHHLIKSSLTARMSFGQQYWMRPDGKYNIRNTSFPIVFATFEKGYAASKSRYEFDHLQLRVSHDLDLSNLGVVGMNVRAGKFFDADGISFVDYRHFNGNQTHIGQNVRYLNVFNLMPYYEYSTNNRYLESHAEWDDRGFVMNKLPLLKHLRSTLVLGFHNLSIPESRPYTEYAIGLNNLGFGKFKVFRLDYLRSYNGHEFREDGLLFGLTILNLLD